MTSQKHPAIVWETGIRHEALRILYYLKRLPERELQNLGFQVFPSVPHRDSHTAIVLPDLNYSPLWKPASKLIPTTPMTAPETLISQVIDILSPAYHPPKTHFLDIPDSFFATLFSFLPEYQFIITHIHFIVTHCGTISQFNLVNSQQSKLTIYLRPDTKINSVLQVIILSLIRRQLQHLENRSWGEIESISDFILQHTIVGASLQHPHYPIMSSLQQKQTNALHRQSQKYLAKLGIPVENNWIIKDQEIYYQSIKIQSLTSRQSGLLRLLLNNYGKVINNDQIADTLWPNGENFSPWAIVKEIARIRQSIVDSGLPGSLLKSHRKIG